MIENRYFFSSNLQELVKFLRDDALTLDPLYIMFCALISTFAMALMLSDVLNHAGVAIMIGFSMRSLALFLVYLLALHSLAIKYPNCALSIHILKKNFHIPPKLMVSSITIIGIFGGALSFASKAIKVCGASDLEVDEPCCCNEFIGEFKGTCFVVFMIVA